MALKITMTDQPSITEYYYVMDNELNATAFSFILSEV